MIDLTKFITEKLRVTTNTNKGTVVKLIDFLKWFYDVDHDYELSIDLINEQSDILYQIEQYYSCSLSEAYHFLMNNQSVDVEIETKGKSGDYEFLIVLKKGKPLRDIRNGDILLRFYKDKPIPEDIKL